MLLVAGLGNPGREHARNRHNAGWMVVDELARRHGGSWRGKFAGQLAEVRVGDERLALLKPETYMNDSGRSVGPATAFFKLEPGDVLVVHDEGDFDLGRLELKVGGGLAGHNGLKSLARGFGGRTALPLRFRLVAPEACEAREMPGSMLTYAALFGVDALDLVGGAPQPPLPDAEVVQLARHAERLPDRRPA